MKDEGNGSPRMASAFGGGLIGTLAGLIGLGGAEFRLPLLIGLFGFGPLEAVIPRSLVLKRREGPWPAEPRSNRVPSRVFQRVHRSQLMVEYAAWRAKITKGDVWRTESIRQAQRAKCGHPYFASRSNRMHDPASMRNDPTASRFKRSQVKNGQLT
jgi:hypothetical protein